MALADLTVINRKLTAGTAATFSPGACVVSTCLREVQIAVLPAGEHSEIAAKLTGVEQRAGAQAYEFLLRLACGLESEIAGETEILGQIKQAWRDHETAHTESARTLRPWMQRLLQDAKEVRSEHVVGLGSATYGSLVRRLLGGTLNGPTLLVGAGQLADTVLPFLDSGEVLVWNRSGQRAQQMLTRQRATQTEGRVHLLPSTELGEADGWRRARNVVICIPADATRDALRVRWWQAREITDGRVLHLGIDKATGSAWQRIDGLATLGDLFGLRDTQASRREQLLARARKACADKAQLALLDDAAGARAGGAHHGWEDLAVFQAFSY